MDAGFNPGSGRYYGPKDGRSRSAMFPGLSKAISRATTALVYKREVTGKENLPQETGYVYSPNHQNTFDPITWIDMTHGDVREMVTIDVFSNPLSATAARLGGAFPVDRFNPSPVTLQHSVDVIAEGASEVIYPQGGFPRDHQIGGIFKGAAFAALKGGGKGIVPIGIHIEEAQPTRLRMRDLLTGAAVATGVAVTALAGAPVVAGALAGAAATTVVAGKLARRLVPQKEYFDPMNHILSGLAGGLAGSAGGAALGAVAMAAAPVVAVPLVAAAAVGGVVASRAVRERPLARIAIQEPIPTADFTPDSDGVTRMSERLHESLAQAKSQLSGVPIDRSQPVFRSSAWVPDNP